MSKKWGIALGLLGAALGIAKYRSIKTTAKGLKFLPAGISGFRYDNGIIKFNIGLIIQNPNKERFDVELRQLEFILKTGQSLVYKEPSATAFTIPANGQVRLPNMEMQIPLSSGAGLISIISSGVQALKGGMLRVTATANGINLPPQQIQL